MSGFDAVASTYDTDFTKTFIGKIQRKRVWRYLNRQIAPGMKVIELNGGTGADAQHLARQGCNVLITDISPDMLEVARSKIGDDVDYQLLDLRDLANLDLRKRFDLIFSNFGGLNCISQSGLADLNAFARNHLTENGKVILVIMPKYNLFDRWYRIWKKAPRIARDSQVPIQIRVGEELIETYFHNPADVEQQMPDFRKIVRKPIGFIPSFFVSFLNHRPFLRALLIRVDGILSLFSGLSSRGDHYLIHLERR